MTLRYLTKSGRHGARSPVLLLAAALLWSVVAAAQSAAAAHPADVPVVSVGHVQDAYTVDAHFLVPQPAAVVLEVLTDYEGIPRFMPDIKTSIVLERTADRTVVEQEAISRVMLFSKRVHVTLEVHRTADGLHFRDTSGESFHRYEGYWRVTPKNGRTTIDYRLTAQPSFAVPPFLVPRLLTRDATEMIARLQAEMASRATRD